MSSLQLDAEALYGDLLAGVRGLLRPQTVLVGIWSGGAWLAERLQRDLQLEGEFGVIVGAVPMACPTALAPSRILLLVQINDVSLRVFGPREMQTGFGFFQAKPSSSFAPVAVTPDEIGERVQTQGMSATGFDEAIRRNAGHLPEVLLVSGEQNARDNRKALSMAGRLPATLISVPDCAHHNVLHALWSRGELGPFLERMFAPPAALHS